MHVSCWSWSGVSSGGSTTVRLALSIRWTGEFQHLFSLAIGSEGKSNIELVAIDLSMAVITGDLGFTGFATLTFRFLLATPRVLRCCFWVPVRDLGARIFGQGGGQVLEEVLAGPS
jgi:hypothetical protein